MTIKVVSKFLYKNYTKFPSYKASVKSFLVIRNIILLKYLHFKRTTIMIVDNFLKRFKI